MPLAIARNYSVLVRASIDTLDDISNRRLGVVNSVAMLQRAIPNLFDLGTSVNFALSYTQEDSGSSDIEAVVAAVQRNFSSSVDDGSFRAIFVTQLRARGASEDFIARAVPASLSFGPRTVTSTSRIPTLRPTSRPTTGLC